MVILLSLIRWYNKMSEMLLTGFIIKWEEYMYMPLHNPAPKCTHIWFVELFVRLTFKTSCWSLDTCSTCVALIIMLIHVVQDFGGVSFQLSVSMKYIYWVVDSLTLAVLFRITVEHNCSCPLIAHNKIHHLTMLMSVKALKGLSILKLCFCLVLEFLYLWSHKKNLFSSTTVIMKSWIW